MLVAAVTDLQIVGRTARRVYTETPENVAQREFFTEMLCYSYAVSKQ